MSAALAGRHVPAAAAHTILGSLGGALAVAAHAGGAAGALLAHTAHAAFMSGTGWRWPSVPPSPSAAPSW